MNAENEKQPGSIEQLVSLLKQAVSSDEQTETELAELGETLLTVVKTALSSSPN